MRYVGMKKTITLLIMCNDFENNGVACITYIEENGTSVLPSDTDLLKVLYLVTFETTKNG